MKYQGKVLNWNDDKGFGFVEPIGGGTRAFVHIKAFKSSSYRPNNGDVIIYELVHGNNNRYKAENIEFTRDMKKHNKPNKAKASKGTCLVSGFIIVFCIGLLLSVMSEKLSVIVVGLYMLMSAITFIAYALDKFASQNGRWRMKESTLHMLSLLGGWPGAFVAQRKLRHKSSKNEFKRVYWVIVVLNLAGLFWLHTEKGADFLNNLLVPLLNG